VDSRRLISDATRRSADDPTMVSDCWESASHGLSGWRFKSALALMPAAAPSSCGASRDCPVASCSAPGSVATMSFEAQIAIACGVSQAACWAARPSKDGRLRWRLWDCSPGLGTSTVE